MKHLVIGKGPWGNNIARELRETFDEEVVQVGRDLPARLDFASAFIATPLSTHAELAKRTLGAGLPTWVEKPAFRSVKELDEVRRCASPPLFVDYTLCHAPGFVELKAAMARSSDVPKLILMELGKALPPRPDCNELWDWAPHFFALYFTLAPWMQRVRVTVADINIPDTYLINVEPVGRPGPLGRLILHTTGPGRRFLQVIGAYGDYIWRDEGEKPTFSATWPDIDQSDTHQLTANTSLETLRKLPLRTALKTFLNLAVLDRPYEDIALTRKVTGALEQLGPSTGRAPEAYDPDVHGPL